MSSKPRPVKRKSDLSHLVYRGNRCVLICRDRADADRFVRAYGSCTIRSVRKGVKPCR